MLPWLYGGGPNNMKSVHHNSQKKKKKKNLSFNVTAKVNKYNKKEDLTNMKRESMRAQGGKNHGEAWKKSLQSKEEGGAIKKAKRI